MPRENERRKEPGAHPPPLTLQQISHLSHSGILSTEGAHAELGTAGGMLSWGGSGVPYRYPPPRREARESPSLLPCSRLLVQVRSELPPWGARCSRGVTWNSEQRRPKGPRLSSAAIQAGGNSPGGIALGQRDSSAVARQTKCHISTVRVSSIGFAWRLEPWAAGLGLILNANGCRVHVRVPGTRVQGQQYPY